MLASSAAAGGVGTGEGDAGGVVAVGAFSEADAAGGADVAGDCGDGDGTSWPQVHGVVVSHTASASVVSNMRVRREPHDKFHRKMWIADWVVCLTGVPL